MQEEHKLSLKYIIIIIFNYILIKLFSLSYFLMLNIIYYIIYYNINIRGIINYYKNSNIINKMAKYLHFLIIIDSNCFSFYFVI